MDPENNIMLRLGMFQLTHPETLSEIELQEILEDSCIDSSTYKNLSRSKLIDLYKRVAMPLPQRQYQNDQNSDTKKFNERQPSVEELYENSNFSNGTHDVRRDESETETSQSSHTSRLQPPVNEFNHTNNKMHLYNSDNVGQCNGADKRMNDESHNDSPTQKRQKITWP